MIYMLLICYDSTIPAEPNAVNRQPEHAKLEQEMRENGVYLGGAALWPIGAGGKTIRQSAGEALVTDGPFAETKEAIGGFFIVDCGENEAAAYAKRIPVDARSWVEMRRVALWHPK